MNSLRTLNRARRVKCRYTPYLLLFSLMGAICSCAVGAPAAPIPTARTLPTPSATVPTVPTPAPASPTNALRPAPSATFAPSATGAPSATLAPTLTRARSIKNVELLSRLGGTYGAAVAVAGDYVYLSVGVRLLVLDIANPGEPIQVGQGALVPSYITSISIWNGYIYVTTESAGVSVFNLSNRKQPSLVGGLPDVKAQHLEFVGDYAYAVDPAGFKIYRVADPTHWVLASSIAFDGAFKRLKVVGQYAYVTGSALHIVDVGNPSRAQAVGTYTGMENATDLAIIGNYAWVLTGYLWHGHSASGELHVVDITNPAKPTKVNVFPFDQPTQRLIVANGFAYIGSYYDLHVLSLSDPRSPRETSSYRASGFIADLASVGTLLMIASSDGDSLRIVSIARPERLGDLASFYTPKGARQMVVADRYAYLADAKYGFLVMDIAERRAPVIVGEATQFFDGSGIALAGNYLYVSSGDRLRVMNLLNPTYAVEVGSLPLPLNGVSRLVVVGNRAYVTGGKVFVVDISHPDTPQLITTLAFPDNQANDLALADHYAIVADTEALRIVDVADPAHPREVSSLRMAGWPMAVRVAGAYAYVVANQSGLHIVNIANPAKPTEVSFVAGDHTRSVTLAGVLAWVSDDAIGLHALDVTTPTKPVDVDAFRTAFESFSATVVDDDIYVVEPSGGIAILRINW